MGGSFAAGGLIPVLPFLTPVAHPEVWASVLTALLALLFGAVKSRYTLKGPLRSGLEFLVVTSAGTVVGVLFGHLLHAV